MRLFKSSAIIFLSILFIGAFTPHLRAKHHSRSHHSTSFSFNLNFDRPRVYEPVVIQPVQAPPVYVERTTYVRPYEPIVEERVYYPYYQQARVERPYVERVYIHPRFSYYSSWGRGY